VSTVYGQYAAYGFGPTTSDDWRDDGACREVDADLFYPLGGEQGHRRTGLNLLQEHEAKRVCNGCPVRVKCREWALETGDDWGIWGGLNENERRALRNPKPELSEAQRRSLARSAEVRAERSASRTHCSFGHELPAAVGSGRRRCPTCAAKNLADFRARQAVSS
jgi:WhiB family redox-sensing transcriptional regulator